MTLRVDHLSFQGQHYSRKGKKAKASLKSPALFLDRDGVIIHDTHYIRDPGEVRLVKGIRELIEEVKQCGTLVVVVTNQSGIGKGIQSWDDYNQVNKEMLLQLGRNAMPDSIYANSLTRIRDIESIRKPGSGMILQAMVDLRINKENSAILGDRITDVECGFNAGLRGGVLLNCTENRHYQGRVDLTHLRRCAKGENDKEFTYRIVSDLDEARKEIIELLVNHAEKRV